MTLAIETDVQKLDNKYLRVSPRAREIVDPMEYGVTITAYIIAHTHNVRMDWQVIVRDYEIYGDPQAVKHKIRSILSTQPMLSGCYYTADFFIKSESRILAAPFGQIIINDISGLFDWLLEPEDVDFEMVPQKLLTNTSK